MSLGNLLEPLLSLGIARIHIWVELARQFPIRRLYVAFTRCPRDPENLVVILVHLVSRRLPRQACVEHVAHTSPVAQSKRVQIMCSRRAKKRVSKSRRDAVSFPCRNPHQ